MEIAHTASDWIGVMSGTSLDGIDAVRVRLVDGRWQGVVGANSVPWADATRDTLLALQQGELKLDARQWATLDEQVAAHYVAAISPLLTDSNPVAGIGMHGQTVFHDGSALRTSLQLGNPHKIAAHTGCMVVSDFRRADMAQGGQGAPLVPAFHETVFHDPTEYRAVLNLGGIANVTLLPPNRETLKGFDVGPGNALLDEWIQTQQGKPYDDRGQWAASGRCIESLLDVWLDDPWFQQPAPKSTGRDVFLLTWLDRVSPGWRDHPPADIQRSLVEFTARSVAASLEGSTRLLVCGGGAFNQTLMEALRTHCRTCTVETTDLHGLPPLQTEASAFAWLAYQRVHQKIGRWHLATGALRPALLGSVSLPPAAADV